MCIPPHPADPHFAPLDRHRLNGYSAQRVPSFFLASSFRMCLNVA